MIASFLVDCRPKNITALLEAFFKKCFFKKKKISEPAKLKYEVKDKNIIYYFIQRTNTGQQTFTCSKSTRRTLGKCVKYFQY